MKLFQPVILLLIVTSFLQGCVAYSVASTTVSVASTAIKTGAKVTGAVVGVAADGVRATSRAVTGSSKNKKSY